MTLSIMQGTSWTSPSGVWHNNAPFAGFGQAALIGPALTAGRAALAAIPKGKLLTYLGLGLGVSQVADMFSGGDDEWTDGEKFDQRMATLQQMWLKFNERVAAQCPAFVESSYIGEYRHDRDNFSKFYAKTGQVTSRTPGFRSPSSAEVGTAKTFWEILIGWTAIAEKMCPGKVAPGLPKPDEEPSGVPWVLLGGGALALGVLYFVLRRSQPQVVMMSAPAPAPLGLGGYTRKRRRVKVW